METLISTRHKRGYKLNFAKENVLILKKQDILFVALAVILQWNEFFSDFILDIEELLFFAEGARKPVDIQCRKSYIVTSNQGGKG